MCVARAYVPVSEKEAGYVCACIYVCRMIVITSMGGGVISVIGGDWWSKLVNESAVRGGGNFEGVCRKRGPK